MQRQRARKSDSQFAFPNAPEYIEPSILREASEWQGLDEYDILVKLEERTGLEAEIAKVPLGADMWGFTYTSREMNRCRIHINRTLPRFWQEFALFHEIHHLLHDSRGCYFWAQTNASMSSFEYQADQFAWAALMPQCAQEDSSCY